MSTQCNYPTDLTDRQWELIEPLLPAPKIGPGKPGRPACGLPTVVNGIVYVNKAGCQWGMLPKEFGRWNTVYVYFNRWSRTETLKRLMERLRSQERQRQGHAAQSSAGCADSQSVKTATQGQAIGFDGGKHGEGRKRHLLVDILGLLLAVVVTAVLSDLRPFSRPTACLARRAKIRRLSGVSSRRKPASATRALRFDAFP